MNLVIRKGSCRDAESFLQLLDEVWSKMDHQEWFYLDPHEEVRRMMDSGEMQLWVAMDGDRLAAAFDFIIPGFERHNYGYDLELSEEELQRVINMDTIAVHPAYRGRGLQQILMQEAEREIQKIGNRILLCTVHPDNHYSLNNILAQGYSIAKSVQKYGSVRYILRKDIP